MARADALDDELRCRPLQHLRAGGHKGGADVLDKLGRREEGSIIRLVLDEARLVCLPQGNLRDVGLRIFLKARTQPGYLVSL